MGMQMAAMNELVEKLGTFGLSGKEASVYLSLLALGRSTVNQIAEKADLIRTTTYDILKGLKEKGLVSSIMLNKTLYFEASPPQKLADILRERLELIEAVVPEMSQLKEETPSRPKVEFYEGKEGVKTVFREILKAKGALCAYSNNKLMVDLLPLFAPNFIRDRVKAGIPIRIFSEDSPTTQKLLVERDRHELRKTRILAGLKNSAMNIYISDDAVFILGSDKNEPDGIIVRYRDFAHCQQIIFEELWKRNGKR